LILNDGVVHLKKIICSPSFTDTHHACTRIPGARIDLYLIQCKTYMSEITMTTLAGRNIVQGKDCVGACAKRVQNWLGSLISREMPLESQIRRHHLNASCTSPSPSPSAKPFSLEIAIARDRAPDVILYRRWPAFLGAVEKSPAVSQTVTLVTQCSVDRFPQLKEQALAYGNAPISVAIYIPYEPSEHLLLQRVRRLHQELADRGSKRVTVSLLFGNAPSKKTHNNLYPVNTLRNLALLVGFHGLSARPCCEFGTEGFR
jgi:hypothetical protein